MAGLRFKPYYLGYMKTKLNLLVRCDDEEEPYRSPVVSVLFDHPTLGKFLYDVGEDEYGDLHWPPRVREMYPIGESQTIKDALAEDGIGVDDLDFIVLSHCHMDHTCGLPMFSGTKAIQRIIVHGDDLDVALATIGTPEEDSSSFARQSLCEIPDAKYEKVYGEIKLADDLILFTQKCHTPGVLGVLAKTENNGWYIFTSDTVYTGPAFEKEIPPGGTINKTDKEFFDNLAFLKDLQKKYNATIIYGHDYDQAREIDRKWFD